MNIFSSLSLFSIPNHQYQLNGFTYSAVQCTQCEHASEVKARMLKKSFVKLAARSASSSHLYTYFCTTNIRKTFVMFIVKPIVFLVVALRCCNTFMKNGWHLVLVMVASLWIVTKNYYWPCCTLHTAHCKHTFFTLQCYYGIWNASHTKHQTITYVQYKSIVGILQTHTLALGLVLHQKLILL